MDMLDFAAFTGRDLQNCRALLSGLPADMSIGDGVALLDRAIVERLSASVEPRPMLPPLRKCPDCGKEMRYIPDGRGLQGLRIQLCRTCQYSEVV